MKLGVEMKEMRGSADCGPSDGLSLASKAREQLPLSVGRIVPAMMSLARYRSLPLSELQSVLFDPLFANRILITTARDSGAEAALPSLVAGFAIWASVSGEVDQKIREQVEAKVFPLRLQNSDWASGDKLWLIDVLAPNQAMAQAVLASFRGVAKDSPVSVHPVVAHAVGRELMNRMKIDENGGGNSGE